MARWFISIGVAIGLLAGAWSESVRVIAWKHREAAERAYYDGDLEGSLAHYAMVRELLPDNPRSYTDPADSISQALEGEYGRLIDPELFAELAGQAARQYLHAIRTAPPNAWAYAGLGSLAGTLRMARDRQTGFDLSGLSTDLIGNLRPEDRLHEAALAKAVQFEPNNYYYRDFLGDFYLRRGFQERALEHFRISVRLQPVLDRHYYLSRLVTVSPAVLSAVETGIKEALESADTAVTAYDIHRFLAAIYLRMGKPVEARACLEAAVEVAPLPHVVEIQIGRILASEGDDAGALEVFRRAAERQPDFHRAWLHLGLTLSRLERHDEAVEAAMRARALKPADYTSLRSLASVLESAGRLDDAAEVLENLIRSHSDHQQPYFQLISLYEKQNRLSNAVRIARQLVSRYPEEPVFAEQLQQLEQAMVKKP